MGRGIKVALAMAISLVFPVMIGLLIYLLIPENKNIAQPKYPEYPSYENYCYSSNSKNYYQSNNSDSCRNILEQIDKKQRAEYDAQVKEYNKLKNSATANRIMASLVAVIVGYIIAAFSAGFTALAVGMTGGSSLLMLASTGFLSSIPENINALMIGLYLACFGVLMILLFRLDMMFPKPEAIEPASKLTGTQAPSNSSEIKQ